MKQRTASRLARSLWLLTLALAVVNPVLAFLNRSEDPSFIVVALTMGVGYATVGALIASRQHRNPVGWLLLTIGLGLMLGGFTEEYTTRGLVTAPGSLPATTFSAWLSDWVFFLAVMPIPLVFLLFPSGQPPSRRWKPLVGLVIGASAVVVLSFVLTPRNLGSDLGAPGIHIANPTGIDALEDVFPVVSLLASVAIIGGTFAAVAALVVRFRRARADERQQIKWLAYAGSAAAVFLIGVFATVPFGEGSLANQIAFYALFLTIAVGIPAACAIAILRYRLYDLDIVVKKTAVFGILVVLVTLVYIAVVVGVGAIVGSTRNTALQFAATAIVALAFQPVRTFARRSADRLVYGKRATPYEVLSEFSERLAGAYSTEDVLPRMVQILAAGTGAERAHVWLRVGGELRPAASWPPEDVATPIPIHGGVLPTFEDELAVEVHHQGELLGALSVKAPPNDPMNLAKVKLVEDLASQAGLVLRNVRLIEELRASRQRLVAAQDDERRKIERNIHDGAQQELVALAVQLKLAEEMVGKDPEKELQLLTRLRESANDALDNLRDLARGIFPPLLADKGLPEALAAQARKAPLPVEIDTDGIGRYPQEVEAAVYFCTLEALQNVAKYANASRVALSLAYENGHLSFEVIDDGAGFEPASTPSGSGLQNMADRMASLGGTFEVRSAPGEGTTVIGRVPGRTNEGV